MNRKPSRFASNGPQPNAGFYVAVVIDGEMVLLVGDSSKDAYAKTKAHKPKNGQFLLLKREHVVVANRIYTTRARFGGKTREIQVDCGYRDERKRNQTVISRHF